MNSTCLRDIKLWYVQKRHAGSSKITGLDELQIIELEHDDVPETESRAPDIEEVDASIQEPASGITISSPRRRVSKHTRTSPTAGEKGKKKSYCLLK